MNTEDDYFGMSPPSWNSEKDPDDDIGVIKDAETDNPISQPESEKKAPGNA